MGKLTVLINESDWIPHDYGNSFFRQPTSVGERLVIGPSRDHVGTLLDLARGWQIQEFYVLYVLLLSHGGADLGRYQSPPIQSFADLHAFFDRFRTFLESDARHHIWIGSLTNEGLLVYDQHDALFAYGDLTRYEQVLVARGFRHRDFWFPSPHSHEFLPANLHSEDDLLQYFPWQHSPLQEGDDWR